MSTYYGMKPIVGDKLKYFLHAFNIQGYDGGDTWDESFELNDQEIRQNYDALKWEFK